MLRFPDELETMLAAVESGAEPLPLEPLPL
jgi:hypothetical protein